MKREKERSESGGRGGGGVARRHRGSCSVGVVVVGARSNKHNGLRKGQRRTNVGVGRRSPVSYFKGNATRRTKEVRECVSAWVGGVLVMGVEWDGRAEREGSKDQKKNK